MSTRSNNIIRARRIAICWLRENGEPKARVGLKNNALMRMIAKNPKLPVEMRPCVVLWTKKNWETYVIKYLKSEVKNLTTSSSKKTRSNKQSSIDFYSSREWRILRYKVLVKYGAVCQCCGASRKNGAEIHIDHIKPRSKYPELELDINNLQCLCKECNLGKLHLDETDWRC